MLIKELAQQILSMSDDEIFESDWVGVGQSREGVKSVIYFLAESDEEEEIYFEVNPNITGDDNYDWAFDEKALTELYEIVREEAERIAEKKHISLDNGNSWLSPAEALDQTTLDALADYMESYAREQAHNTLDLPCTDLEFLTRYMELAPCDLIIG